MARLSSYEQDGTLNKTDKVIGTDSVTGGTKNYTIESMLELVNSEGLVEAFDGASFAYRDYIPTIDNPRGIINLNASVASQVNFSDVNQIYISTNDALGASINEYLDNSLNNQIKLSKKGNLNQFGIYEVTAITSHDNGGYKLLTVTPRAYNGLLTPSDAFFLSNYSAVFDEDFSDNSVTEFGDVTNAGSGIIITGPERTSLEGLVRDALVHADVVDNVTTTSTDVPLSANQGKLLNDAITTINTLLVSDNVNLDALQEVVDFIEANRDTLDNLAISNIAGLQTALSNKQDREEGKGLSARDFTEVLLNKLNGIASNAEVNVQSNWSATTGDSFIQNKPTDVTDLSLHNVVDLADVTTVGSGNIITGPERTKLNAINVNDTNRTITDGTTQITLAPQAAEQNVNADWSATTGDAEILNKPALAPSNAEQNVQSNWGEDDLASDSFIQNKPTDVTVISNHSVEGLNDVTSAGSGIIITGDERSKLTLIEPGAEVNVNADWNATAGDAQILNKPNLQADWGETDSDSTTFINNKPALAPSNAERNVQVNWNEDDGDSDAYVLNKPSDLTVIGNHSVEGLSDVTSAGSGSIITAAERNKITLGHETFIGLSNPERTKLTSINVDTAARTVTEGLDVITIPPASAEQNVQSDWEEDDAAEDSFILNKPDTAVTKAKVDIALDIDTATDSHFYRGDGEWADPLATIELGDLADVDEDWTNPSINPGRVLRWSTSLLKWVGSTFELEDLLNVNTNNSNSVGKVLAATSYNGAHSMNQYDAVELDLSYLSDFNVTSPSDNQILQYDSTNSEFINKTDVVLPGTLEFGSTETTTPAFDNGLYYTTENGHDTLHFRYHDRDLSIDHLTENIPTGILNGGELTKASATEFTIAAGDGVINVLNKSNSDPHPEIKKISWVEQTITVSGLDSSNTAQLNSWIYVDSSGVVQQQSTNFTDAQKGSNIIIGAAIHSDGVVRFVKTFPHTGYNTTAQLKEFVGIFGALKKSGHKITANGANLSIDRSAGVAFALGRNYVTDPLNPSTVSDAAKTACVIHRYYSDGSNGFVLDDGVAGAGYTSLDPGKYDDGDGTLASVSGGHYSVQRLYYFPGTPNIVVSYYGKNEYNSLDSAENNYNKEDFIEAENTADQAIFLGTIIMRGNTTALNNTANAKILTAGAFRSLAPISTGGALIATSLNDLSDVSIQSAAEGHVLKYDTTNAVWENVADTVEPITLDTINTRVGINDATPTATLDITNNDTSTTSKVLDVKNNSSNSLLLVQNNGDVTINTNLSAGGNVSSNVLHVADGLYHQDNTTNSIRFGTDTMTFRTSNIPRMKMGSTGIIDVYGDLRVASHLRHVNDADTYLIFGTDTIGFAAGKSNSADDNDISITTTGVGIREDAPSDPLDVNGTVRLRGGLKDSNNTLGASGQILSSTGSATDWVSLSDLSGVNGTGTANYLTKWLDADSVTDSIIYDNGTNVGIGTNSPSVNLHVSDAVTPEIRIEDTTNNRRLQFFVDNNFGYIRSSTGTDMLFNTNGANERMRIHSGGDISFKNTSNSDELYWDASTSRLGIGTTSPGAKLHVKTSSSGASRFPSLNGIDIESTGVSGINILSPNDGYGRIYFGAPSSNTAGSIEYVHNSTVSSGHLILRAGATNTMYIKDGNVGIGTDSPVQKLQVDGSIYSNGGEFYVNTNQGITAVGNLIFKAHNGTSYFEGMRIASTGNVGIGAISPGQKLHVAGNIRVGSSADTIYSNRFRGLSNADVELSANNGYDLILNSNSGDNVGIGTATPSAKIHVSTSITAIGGFNSTNSSGGYAAFYNSGAVKGFIGYGSTLFSGLDNNNFGLRSQGGLVLAAGGNTPRLYVESSGNVGIGTIAPSEKLHVNGKIKHSGILTTEGTNIDQIKTFDTTLQLTADTWTDTGINSADLATGTYAMQVYVEDNAVSGHHYEEYYSGIISWYSNNTNDPEVDEIVLHRAGHAAAVNAHMQFRTERSYNADANDLMLQIKSTRTHTGPMDGTDGNTIRFKFRRLI